MKVLSACALISFAAGFLVLALFVESPGVKAMPGQSARGATITCSSNDMRRVYCPADTRGGVQLINQRGSPPCIFGQTWGYDRRGIWVDRGCRADFAVGYTGGPGGPAWPGWGNSYTVYCSSDSGRRSICPVDTRGGVRLVRQRMGPPCIYGQSWGYNSHGIWVDRGCRADFEIGPSGWRPPAKQVIFCGSDNGRRKICPVDTRSGARIIRQRSDADCIFGRSWGYDARGIWVDRGCRADFEVGIPR